MEINYPYDIEAIKCTDCNTEMLEGYYNEDEGHTFCSSECMDHYYKEPISEKLKAMDIDDLNDSVIYWTEWDDYSEERERYKRLVLTLEELKTSTDETDNIGLYMAIDREMLEYCNDENRYTLKKVWIVGFNIYFDRYTAELLGNDTEPSLAYIPMRPYQTIREGAIQGAILNDLEDARRYLKQIEQEDQNR